MNKDILGVIFILLDPYWDKMYLLEVIELFRGENAEISR